MREMSETAYCYRCGRSVGFNDTTCSNCGTVQLPLLLRSTASATERYVAAILWMGSLLATVIGTKLNQALLYSGVGGLLTLTVSWLSSRASSRSSSMHLKSATAMTGHVIESLKAEINRVEGTIEHVKSRFSSLGSEASTDLGEIRQQIDEMQQAIAELRKSLKELSQEALVFTGVQLFSKLIPKKSSAVDQQLRIIAEKVDELGQRLSSTIGSDVGSGAIQDSLRSLTESVQKIEAQMTTPTATSTDNKSDNRPPPQMTAASQK